MFGYGFSMLLNPYRFGTAGGGYLSDDYPPSAYFSLRKTSSTATNAIRVRRSSDNSEQDIGFSGDDLDTASLESFCSATDGYIVTWYDQSGNANNLTQSTAANQPQIVSSGTTLTDPNNGLSGALCNGSSHSMTFTSADNTASTMTAVGVYNRASSAINSQILNTGGGGLNVRIIGWKTDNNNQFRLDSSPSFIIIDATNTATGNFIDFLSYTSPTVSYWKNNVSKAGGSYTFAASDPIAGAFRSGGLYHNGYVQEFGYWLTDEVSNRTEIQDNINTYYSIY